MNTLRPLAFLAVLSPLLAGCVPSVEDICQHAEDIAKKERGDTDRGGMDEDHIKAALRQCEAYLAAERDKVGPSAWEAWAKCSMAATSSEQLAACKLAAG